MKAVLEEISPKRTRVKICGLTRSQDVQAAVDSGADAIGLVFYPKSKRCVSLEQAAQLRHSVPAFVTVVALFVNADSNAVQQVIDQVQPDLLQFHGDESADYCDSFKQRYIRAFRVGAPGLSTPDELKDTCRQFPKASAWLFDSYSEGYGGSGKKFDAHCLHVLADLKKSPPFVLAGGMNSENVAQSIRAHSPYGIDVSSGVEDEPGIKSGLKIRTFMSEVMSAGRR